MNIRNAAFRMWNESSTLLKKYSQFWVLNTQKEYSNLSIKHFKKRLNLGVILDRQLKVTQLKVNVQRKPSN